MTKFLLLLMVVGLWSGCNYSHSPDYSPGYSVWYGPEGQPIEVYYGKDSEGNRIEYEFYMSGPDTIKHGYYDVYYEEGPKRFEIRFLKGKRNGFERSYPLHEGCDTGEYGCVGPEVEGKHDVEFWQDDKCDATGEAMCEGDEYDGY